MRTRACDLNDSRPCISAHRIIQPPPFFPFDAILRLHDLGEILEEASVAIRFVVALAMAVCVAEGFGLPIANGFACGTSASGGAC